MLTKAITEVLAPFSAHIQTFEIHALYYSSFSQFHPLPQLDFRALRHLSFPDEPNYHHFMMHILDTVQNTAIGPVSYRLYLYPGTFQSILNHSAIIKAVKLDIDTSKFFIT
jgi:hypothetical protein